MTLHHRLDGPRNAPVLVLGSSLGTSLEMWDAQVPALAATHRVLRYDRRGHGGSPPVAGPVSIDDLGGDVLELANALEFERFAVCGSSLGGLEAMWLACQAPERVERLVLCCTKPALPPVSQWRERSAIVRVDGIEAIADAVLGRWFTPAFHASEPFMINRFRQMLLETDAHSYAACCEAIADADLWTEITAIEAPTLVITGANDPVVTPADGEQLRETIPHAEHVIVEEAAHIPNVEQPERVTDALLAHLNPIEEAR